jgi:protein ImuB
LAALLAPLPVAALRLSPQGTRTLERLGLKTIGALSGIERRSLARRFREADNPLDALDRMLGRKPEPLTATRAEPPPRASLRMAEPVADPAVLASALARLADPLAQALAERRLGALRILFQAFRVDGEVGEAAAETARPTRDAAHLVRLLSEKLQHIDPGFGFDAFALTAAWCEPLDASQDALIGEPPLELELARLIDRLVARLGRERVRRPSAHESHLPERASGWAEGLSPPLEREGREGRPQRLLDAPEAIAVVYATPEGLPRRFVWRRAVHDIARVEGPERIAPEWWRAPSSARLRDYYRVEDASGRRFWIYREGLVGDGRGGAPAWYLHGLFG